MAQATDYSLANQSGANFRSELNTILAAIVSQNSGSTAPSTTYAYQWWIDTGVSPALLKLRNAANSAWITIGDVTAANLGLLTSASAASTYLALAGGTVTGNLEIGTAGSLTFEGSTANAFETTLAVTDPTADRTITLPDATTTLAGLAVVQTFTAAQRGTISALGAVSAGTTTLDFATANHFSLTLPAGGTVTLANPSNLTAGQSGAVVITQNAGTAATVAYGSAWKFKGGAPSVSTTLSSVNTIAYFVESATRITATLLDNPIS